ncbi:MAG: hypothetical protein NC102_00510 [Clostridium sp.]|nr:hypothetical protein [Clostridium sp.]
MAPIIAQAQTESRDTTALKEIIVSGPGEKLPANSRITRISAAAAGKLTHSVGEADLANSVKGLAGVYASSDYSSGFSIEGASPSQNIHYINSAPIIFPYRFGGVFSTFNTYHFSGVTFRRRPEVYETPHLGGSLNFTPSRPTKKLEGAINAGMTAASASIASAMPNGLYIRGSGRISYLNQLYGSLLKTDKNAIEYSFADLNLTAGANVAGGDLQLNVFHNFDRLDYADRNYSNDTKMEWRNTLAALHYTIHRNYSYASDLYYSDFSNTLTLDNPQSALKAPSSLKTIGAHFTASSHGSTLRVKYTANAELYLANPQRAALNVTSDKAGEFSDFSSPLRRETLFSIGAGTEATWNTASDKLELTAAASAGFARSRIEGRAYNAPHFSPSLRALWKAGKNSLEAEIALRSQYLHRVGLSELGLASDFWIVANRRAPLERSLSASLCWEGDFLPWGLHSQVKAYHSWIYNEPEYRGVVLEIIQSDYDPLSRLIICDGYNAGASVALSREIGQIMGTLSYSYGTGRRHLRHEKNSWRALNSEGHSLKGQIMWQRGEHWVFGSTMNLSSGRVYTPVKSLYAIGGNIALDYGKRNSSRLPMRFSLNLSATYQFNSGRNESLRHSINLSIINATNHKNTEMQYFILDSEKGAYSLKKLYSMYNFLPSISYSIEFK